MKLFTRLYTRLDQASATNDKVEALREYFREGPPEDAAWVLYFLTGRRIKRALSSAELRRAACEASGIAPWLLDECYDAVGDLSETISLLLPGAMHAREIPLHEVVERIIGPMRRMSEEARRRVLLETWDRLPDSQRFVFHKLIAGSFRVGVSRTLAVRALAMVADIPQAEMDHRLMGDWEPTGAVYAGLIAKDGATTSQIARPYPFFLASQLDEPPETLGERGAWQAEWKWDGIRAQLIRRAGTTLIWSRGEELVTDRFPEIVLGAERIPDGTVLDGEILAWEPRAGGPLPFAALQTRIGRTRHRREGEWLFVETPVSFLCYDVLEWEGRDVRLEPLRMRRAILEKIIASAGGGLRLSPVLEEPSWESLATRRGESRSRGVEGLMLKRLDSAYQVGRARGDWWKWKIDPYVVDAVLIAAQPGHGRRASLFTDYTFGVWSGAVSGEGELVPIAKAYSGLTDEEIARVDAEIRAQTIGKFGPVRTVRPTMVFELAFEGIQASTRHRSGIAVRFPRIARQRMDKRPQEADTLDFLRRLLASTQAREA